MLPGGGGGGVQDCTKQGHTPTTNHSDPDGGAPSDFLPPPFPTEMKKPEHAASLPGRSPSTGNGGHDEDAPPFPCTETEQEQEQHPLGSLPVDALTGILSRVPYKSLCRFKCVSKPWKSLCSDPDRDIRKRCPQTLYGFFYTYRRRFKFHNLSGRGPPLVDPTLPFLRGIYDLHIVEQCCSSLLLCRCWKDQEAHNFDYVVCNPMTGQWTVLPPVAWKEGGAFVSYSKPIVDIFLGFDPAAPSRFMVFVPISDWACEFSRMAIYSSESGQWTMVRIEWGYKTILVGNNECVLLNDTMHLATHYGFIVTVDSEGKVSREIEMPADKVSIGQCQGCLYAWHIDDDDIELYVWVLENSVSGEWILKHTVSVPELFGRQRDEDDMSYIVFAMHPDCKCIFITDQEEMAVSYDLDNQKVNISCTFEEFEDVLPYIPCFEEWSNVGTA